jgi:hypothetical protein
VLKSRKLKVQKMTRVGFPLLEKPDSLLQIDGRVLESRKGLASGDCGFDHRAVYHNEDTTCSAFLGIWVIATCTTRHMKVLVFLFPDKRPERLQQTKDLHQTFWSTVPDARGKWAKEGRADSDRFRL